MSPADQRVLQLLSKWQASLELHLRYAALPDEQYWLIQPWPRHERATRWVIELARQRVGELRRMVEARVAAGDSSLSEALEVMGFLSNLVGAQLIERYIPLAEPANERAIEAITMATPAASAPEAAPQPDPTPPMSPMPDFSDLLPEEPTVPRPTPVGETQRMEAPARPRAAAEDPTAASDVRRSRASGRHRAVQATGSARRAGASAAAAAAEPGVPQAKQLEVIADAVRLLKWGREWHELPDSIARMAGRPPATQVRLILRSHRAAIEQQSRGGRSN